ncbi:hypothetical protein V2J09_001942 [Rumex salicifolius]
MLTFNCLHGVLLKYPFYIYKTTILFATVFLSLLRVITVAVPAAHIAVARRSLLLSLLCAFSSPTRLACHLRDEGLPIEDLKMEFGENKSAFYFLCIIFFACCHKEVAGSDNYLFDCGSPANTSVGTRVFLADSYASKYISVPQNILGNTSSNSVKNSNLPLYQTARIFTGTLKFTLPISQTGRHFIRLYFFPFVYNNYDMTSAKFAVSAQGFVLLSDFTPQSSATMKEYLINVTSSSLVITFVPSTNSIGFLSALEVVYAPDSLIIDDANSISPAGNYNGLTLQAFETVARVNMGGSAVNYDNDTLWRSWVTDDAFLLNSNLAVNVSSIPAVRYASGLATKYSAPATVYGTAKKMNSENDPKSNFNVTWEFDVDTGFQHLIRFHYCDIVSSSLNQLYFDVYLDSWMVSQNLDLASLTSNLLATPVFVDSVTPETTSGKLRVSIGPSSLTGVYPKAILNGLEIMKMNNSRGSLSGNVAITATGSSSKSKVGMIVGVVCGACVLVMLGICFIFCKGRRKKQAGQGHSKTWIPLSLTGGSSYTMGSKFSNGTTLSAASNLGYRVPFSAVQEATNSFDESLAIGIGGFGKVYKGVLSDGTNVAVKRGNPRSQQGLAEFRTEIDMLSQFRHRHLVSLIGYCDEKNEMILIYEYMENVVCARPVIDPTLPREMVNLAEWAMKWQKRGQLDQIIDPSLAGKLKPESLRKFGETAEKCLADFGVDRPSMGDILWNLEYALQLQEAVVNDEPEDNSTNMIGDLSPQINNLNQDDDGAGDTSAMNFEGANVDDLSGVSMSKVFSQLVKSEGR